MKKRILNNYHLKLLSLAVAVGLWWFVYIENHPLVITSYRVPVTYSGLPADMSVTGKQPSITIYLQGTRTTMEHVEPADIGAALYLKNMKAGTQRVPVRIANDTRATLVPKSYYLTVRLVQLRSKRFPVHVEFAEEERPDVSVTATPAPSRVDVFGPAKQLSRITHVVAIVDVGHKNDSFSTWATPAALDANGNALSTVRVSPSEVQVHIGIAEQLIRKTVPLHILYAQGAKQGGGLTPSTITVSGTPDVVSGVQVIMTKPVDTKRCSEAESFPVPLDVPQNLRSDTTRAVFSCEKRDSVSLTVPVEAEDTPQGLNVSFDPPIIAVTVFGPMEKLSTMRAHDIIAMVSVAAAGEGEHTLPVDVRFRKDTETFHLEFRPTMVRATITAKRSLR